MGHMKFKIGDDVYIPLREYNGIVEKTYNHGALHKYGVRIPGERNPNSDSGVFWFKEEELMTTPVTLKEAERAYIKQDCECRVPWFTDDLLKKVLTNQIYPIEKVIFNDPATIVLWQDGSKTVVKCSENDIYDPEKGLAMAIVKRLFGNDNTFHKIFNKWVPEEAEPEPNDLEIKRQKVEEAYKILTKIMEDPDASEVSIDEAVGFLGEVLSDE